MRKSGWAAAAGLVSAGLLLTACGGSSPSSTAASGGTSSPASGAGSTPSAGAASTSTPNPHASSNITSPPPGAVYFDVSRSAKGWVMAEGDGQIVYTYAGDSVGKASTCTGACAALWLPVKGTGLRSTADNAFPSSFGTIAGQITYGGLPLYTYKGELPYANHEGGQWKSISLPESLVVTS
jgi:predicted lipoprotein with Yx(FWY)xxD motif